MDFFDSFMSELVDITENMQRPLFSKARLDSLVNFLKVVTKRIQVQYPVHKLYCEDILSNVDEIYNRAQMTLSEMNFNSADTQNQGWKLRMNNLSFSRSTSSSVLHSTVCL